MVESNFSIFVERTCDELAKMSMEAPERIAACKSGEDFEICVVEAAQAIIDIAYPGTKILYIPKSHVFPDIIVEFSDGTRYGIEVKSSSSTSSKNWKINGNSVLGSTKEDVLDTYIIFGKTAKGHQAFRFKRYEDAVANVGVTHSPRYLIDMDIAPEETFFAKSGLSYQQISESNDPIRLITSYFRSQGERAWWLGEDAVTPAVIRLFSDLPVSEQNELIGYCFAHFPEVFSAGPKKFHRCVIWLATERSVLSPNIRDNFSAKGRADVVLASKTFPNLPRVFTTLHDRRRDVQAALSAASSEELLCDWGLSHAPQSSLVNPASDWARVSAMRISQDPQVRREYVKILYAILTDK